MTNDELRQLFLDDIAKTGQLILEYQEMTRPVATDVAIVRISRMDASNKSVADAVLRQTIHTLQPSHFSQRRGAQVHWL